MGPEYVPHPDSVRRRIDQYQPYPYDRLNSERLWGRSAKGGLVVTSGSGRRAAHASGAGRRVLPVLASFVAALALMALPMPSAHTLAAYDWPQVQCGANQRLVLPYATIVEDDGWTRLDYQLDGVDGYQEVPPSGFDAVAASPTTLTRHHLPLPQSDQGQLGTWTKRWGRAVWTRVQGMCVGLGNPNSAIGKVNAQWGGSEVRYTQSYSFTGVEGTFIQPAPGRSCGATFMSSWVGLGGDPGTVIQAGTEASVSMGGTQGYQAFAEIYPPLDDHWYLSTVSMTSGSHMFAMVELSGGVATFGVINDDTGRVGWYNFNVGTSSATSAEWIDEKPSLELPNYGTTNWSSMYVLRSNSSAWTTAYSEPIQWAYSIQSGGVVESRSSGIASNNTMHDTWASC